MGRLNCWVLRACAVLMGAGLAGAAQAVGTDGAPLRLLYQERPPYSIQQPDGTVTGSGDSEDANDSQ